MFTCIEKGAMMPPVFILNAFPLQFPKELNLQYEFWTIDPIPTTPILRQLICDDLRWKYLKRPVAKSYLNGSFAFAVNIRGRSERITHTGRGEKTYAIEPSGVTKTINLSDPDEGEIELVKDMLFYEFNTYLGSNKSLVKGFASGSFYSTIPDEPYNPRPNNSPKRNPEADIYRGFSFRVGFLEKYGFCITVDVHSSYIGKRTLANDLGLINKVNEIDSLNGITQWVIDYRNTMQSVYLVGIQDKTIGEVIVNGKTIYQYLYEKYPQVRERISESDRAASTAYTLSSKGDEQKHYTAATTLMRPKLKLNSPAVKSLNDKPAFPAAERLQRIQTFVPHFSGARISGINIDVGNAVEIEQLIFDDPRLIFGDNQTLELKEIHQNPFQARKQWGSKKLAYLSAHGAYKPKQFSNPFFVYPAKLEQRGLLDKILEETQNLCKTFGKSVFDPKNSSYRDNATVASLKEKIRGIVDTQKAGFILLALPDNADDASKLYAFVKSEIPIPSKCFSAAAIRRHVERNQLQSYIQHNTLGMLVQNETVLWGLADELNYEMHIGIDVARSSSSSLMGATSILDSHASMFRFDYVELPPNEDKTLKEAIPVRSIGKFVLERLQSFFDVYRRSPHNILFHRDGRVFETESDGISKAIERFVENNKLDLTPQWTIISVTKSNSMKLRIFSQNNSIDGPLTGSYYVQNSNTGFLITSGSPTLPQGTPQPIQIEIIEDHEAGDVSNIDSIMRDVYWLSHLNWTSPEITTSLPFTIRFTDKNLERYIIEASNEDDEGWD